MHGESAFLTMPRMGLKSDERGVGTLLIRSAREAGNPAHTREVRNTISANSAVAATTTSDPTIGSATKA